MYDVASMSCSYVLAGHTDIVLCLDTCTTSSGRTLIVTGSKDNTVSSPFGYTLVYLIVDMCFGDFINLLSTFVVYAGKIMGSRQPMLRWSWKRSHGRHWSCCFCKEIT